uniref:Uncharacterized protein n=1 Tax=Cannabis sativa TaxID=3483 RepID=A0A803PCQ1_CANSA
MVLSSGDNLRIKISVFLKEQFGKIFTGLIWSRIHLPFECRGPLLKSRINNVAHSLFYLHIDPHGSILLFPCALPSPFYLPNSALLAIPLVNEDFH